MDILYFLIPLGLLLLGLAVWAFFWAVGSGQFDDLDTPAIRVVMDDDSHPADEPDEPNNPDNPDNPNNPNNPNNPVEPGEPGEPGEQAPDR